MINTPSPTDLWWNIREVPFFGNIQIGNEKEPFSLGAPGKQPVPRLHGTQLGQDAFISPSANGFAPGILAWNYLPSRRGTYAYGLFKNVTDAYAFNVGNGQAEGAGRITLLPWYDEPPAGDTLRHIGWGLRFAASTTASSPTACAAICETVQTFWCRPGRQPAHRRSTAKHLNPEFMLQYGPLFVQSEFQGNWTTNSVAWLEQKATSRPASNWASYSSTARMCKSCTS